MTLIDDSLALLLDDPVKLCAVATLHNSKENREPRVKATCSWRHYLRCLRIRVIISMSKQHGSVSGKEYLPYMDTG